ncbi:type VII secretion protein EccB [Nocardia transvalensis]|uniref:type VII secretion protein EccB n=1 Tax=Nocardia transvalensis TaxID=37333 RepID=UPI001895E696|nr:type VII secretion protein EccB [Nocardia transvalensis]MBF6327517.1 type VII secretion protein EccB [Nocardia transvalensis]
MPAQLTTKQQVNGYRFLLKRYEHALIRRDVRMLHDPMRSQFRSLVVGAVLGVLVVAGAAILAFLRPQGSVGKANIVMGKESGALYAKVDNTLHPVLNLASARLITGSNEKPTSVKESKLNLPRGALLGIPGAPAALPGSAQGEQSTWTLCDAVPLSEAGTARRSSGARTTVIAGELSESVPGAAHSLAADEALLVSREGKTYLLFDGKRAEVDPRDSVLVRSLGLRDHHPRPISAGLLNSAVQVPPLTPPAIDRIGEPGPSRLSGVPIGGVIRVQRVDSAELYVVLADGVQRVSPFAAEVIRNANSQEMKEITAVPPDRLVGIPVVNRLPVDQFPGPIPKIMTAEEAPIGCITWSKAESDPAATVTLLAGRALPLPESSKPVELATADGTGDRVDAAYLRPNSGEYVQATGIEPGSIRQGSLFYIADNGIRYGIPDAPTATVLGLEQRPRPAPWPILGQLVPGPTLSRTDALISHDTLPTSP